MSNEQFNNFYRGYVVRDAAPDGMYVWSRGWCACRSDAILFTQQEAINYIEQSGRNDLVIEPACVG